MNIVCAHCPDEIIPTISGWTHLHGVHCTGQDGYEACNQPACRATVCDTCGAPYDGHHRCDPFGHPAESEPDNDYPYLKGWR